MKKTIISIPDSSYNRNILIRLRFIFLLPDFKENKIRYIFNIFILASSIHKKIMDVGTERTSFVLSKVIYQAITNNVCKCVLNSTKFFIIFILYIFSIIL